MEDRVQRQLDSQVYPVLHEHASRLSDHDKLIERVKGFGIGIGVVAGLPTSVVVYMITSGRWHPW